MEFLILRENGTRLFMGKASLVSTRNSVNGSLYPEWIERKVPKVRRRIVFNLHWMSFPCPLLPVADIRRLLSGSTLVLLQLPGDILMASSVPSAQDPYADRRVYPRVPVALPAFLQANGARHHVQILDLSAGGAKLNCAVSLSSGTAVVLDCGTLGGPAVVRWQNGGLLGLCFDSELDPQEISALIERSKALASRMKISD